jgi:hypothetical protein
MNIYDCIKYEPGVIDYIFPNIAFIYKLCLSKDKTKLFLVSFIRLIFITIIFFILRAFNLIELNLNKLFKTSFYGFILSYLIINFIYLIIVVFKQPAIDKYELEESTSKMAAALKKEEYTKPVILKKTPTNFV